MRHPIPPPPLLVESPELGVLHSVQALGDVALRMLLAAHPELEQADFFPDSPPLVVDAYLAEAIVTHLDGLDSAIDRYRHCLAQVERRRIERLELNEF